MSVGVALIDRTISHSVTACHHKAISPSRPLLVSVAELLFQNPMTLADRSADAPSATLHLLLFQDRSWL